MNTAPQMEDDLDRIMRVMEAAFDSQFGEAWTARQVSDSLLLGNTRYLLAGSDGENPKAGQDTVGFAVARRAADEEELLLLAVLPEMRGRGIGRRLIERLASSGAKTGVSRFFLEMRAGNPAEHLYRSCGFQSIGLRRAYYRQPDGSKIDAITFAKEM